MEIKLFSSLVKVFKESSPVNEEITGISFFRNERISFQIAVCSETDCNVSLSVYGFPCKTDIFTVKDVPVNLACNENADDYYLRKIPGSYPDILVPFSGNELIEADVWHSFWVELSADNSEANNYDITVFVSDGGNEYSKHLSVEIIDAELPEIDFVYTNWYHCDGISNYYNVPVFSDEFWRINRNFIKNAVSHGMNCILTPLFTPPLDTAVGGERLTVQLVDVKKQGNSYLFDFSKLKKWIDICLDCGIKYFEMSHLFTQWGALHSPKIVAEVESGIKKIIFGWDTETDSKEYDDFILQLGEKLVPFLENAGIKNSCFFHVSDEPSEEHLEVYKKRSELIEKAFPGFKTIDALSNIEFYKSGAVKQPIPETGSAEKFYGIVPDLWVYYCCGQGNRYLSNRFIAMPSQRTRVLGCQLFKYNAKGFLQWGHNFYNSALSLKQINPFEITDADGNFPAGDAFVVYPGENGVPLPSLRLKVFYDALQDFRALKFLESLIGREKTVELLEKDLVQPLTFTQYPHSDKWQLSLRENINNMIKANLKKSGI